ncbi:ABC transporter substrate-binding protein [Pseudodesulfovibrio cashew]|uniref:ABC transporter substrate-binding protein n=1 Tax=Pseudodesulfovibrio cashew TaxID=2678688 RepID=A0A6I6JJJ4_9BACT|nr:ABC transporter substrate-binding protein [Pseudodesulfovibrio cashew]QGY41309.1 ABC transporter substrate-binding protein [Pseudodesulfovibrio cashew]
MTLSRYLGIIAIFCALFLTACSDASPIIVGFSGQLTGSNSDLGTAGRNGVILALENINAAGGIDGRPLELLTADDHNTPEGAIQADRELIDAGVVAIIGHMTSSLCLAAMPQISENGIVMISPTASSPQFSGKVDAFFRTMMEASVRSKDLAEYAYSRIGINSVVSVAESDNKSYSFSFIANFGDAFKALGGRMVGEITYSTQNPQDWQKLIAELKEKRPDALLLACPAQDAAAIVQKINFSGLHLPILSGSWAYTERLLLWGGRYAEGMIFAIDYAFDNPRPEFIKFKEHYKNRFGKEPNFASAFSYEATLALAEGLKKTKGTPTGLANAMAPSQTINGVVGPFKLNPFGDVTRKVFIVTVQNKEFRTLEMR